MSERLAAWLFLVLLIAGCGGGPPTTQTTHETGIPYVGYSHIVEIRGCEYVVVKSAYGLGVAHAGNCKHHMEGQ